MIKKQGRLVIRIAVKNGLVNTLLALKANYKRIIVCLMVVFLIQSGTIAWADDDQAIQNKIDKIQSIIDTRNKAVVAGKDEAAAWKSPMEDDFKSSGMNMLQGLGVCVGLFLVVAHFLKKYGGAGKPGKGNRLRVIDKCLLAPKTHLMMIEVDGEGYLITVGSERVTLIRSPSNSEITQAITLDQALKEICESEENLAA